MKVVWSRRFVQALFREYEFLRSKEPVNALSVRERLIRAASSLAQFPDRGRAWRVPGSRELLVPGLPYVIIYRVKGDEVLIVSLFHTSQDWPAGTN